ncbi:MAG TPA: methyl-accepting chemotaxis protein [Gemmatimonadaceae bacterium]|nr:methyl-accepting chemotaxis protein [Gemmatimonadaceae bacterium]
MTYSARSTERSSSDGQKQKRIQERLVLYTGGIALVIVAIAAYVSLRWISGSVENQVNSQLLDAANRSAALVDAYVHYREHLVRALAMDPTVVDASLAGDARARTLGLPGKSMAELEQQFRVTRSLDVDPRAKSYLRRLLSDGDMVEVLLTDAAGRNAVTTELSSDFVQSDEDWWTDAARNGFGAVTPAYDESAGVVSVAMAATVREDTLGTPQGVIKVVFDVDDLDGQLQRAASTSGVAVQLVDQSGAIIAGSGTLPRLRPIPDFPLSYLAGGDSVVRFGPADGMQLAALASAYGGKWHLVAHMPEQTALAPLRAARYMILGVTLFALIVLGVLLMLIARFVARRVSQPAERLAVLAERVSGGDLTVEVVGSESNDELGRLSRATRAMVHELRRLVSAINDASTETSAMAAEITAATEEMSAAASEMASTSNELSHQSSGMAETIQHTAADASRLMEIAGRLADGSREGVERNAQLRVVAQENRQRLDESAHGLAVLAEDAKLGTESAEALVVASEEIRAFVTLVRKMARQSKLLSLNASMEAARAGERGEGFAVVASEIRKLAAGASDAADRTEKTVQEVLSRVDAARASSQRTAQTVGSVQRATQLALESFTQVEQAVVELERWTTSIDESARDSRSLIASTSERLETLARGTESFAAAMEQVAASAEEQSASTQQIAATAAQLADAAERLTTIVATFNVGESAKSDEPEDGAEHADANAQSGGASERRELVGV